MNVVGRILVSALAVTALLASGAAADPLVAPVSALGEIGAGVPSANVAAASVGGRVQVVSDPAGGFDVATWTDRTSGADRLLVASRRAGTWSGPQVLASSPVGRRATATAPVPVRLVIGAGGTAHLLWGAIERGDGTPHRWSVASLAADGVWSEHAVVRATTRRRLGMAADLAVRADGALMVAWSTATLAPTDFQQKGAIPAGRLRMSERSPAGTWLAARTLGASHGVSAIPTVVVNRAGGAAVVWAPTAGDSPDPPDRLRWSVREAGGRWPAGGTVRAGAGYALHPLLDGAGRLHLFRAGYGPWGMSGLAETVVGPRPGAAPKFSPMPTPTDAQAMNGWLGAGYFHTVDVALDAAGNTVVVWGGEPYDVERGGYGTGAVWSAVRGSNGAWTLGLVDPLTATAGALDVDLSTDPSGRVVATWSASTTDCRSLIYRSVRDAGGVWSPRSVVAVGGRGQPLRDADLSADDCAAVTAGATSSPQPLGWWVEQGPRRLVVVPLEDSVQQAPEVSIDVPTTTWAQVRAAGGLPIRCSAVVAVVCSASVVEAIAGLPRAQSATDPLRYRRAALGTLALRASSFVAPAVGQFTLPSDRRSSVGSAPPTISFEVLVTADVVGGTAPVVRRIPVTLTR